MDAYGTPLNVGPVTLVPLALIRLNPFKFSGPLMLCCPLAAGFDTIACGYCTTPEYSGVPWETFTVPLLPPLRYHFCGKPAIPAPFTLVKATVYPVKLGCNSSLNLIWHALLLLDGSAAPATRALAWL